MDLHIELELLKIDQSSTVGQINGLEAQIVTLKERALLLQKRTERLESINGVSKAESSSAAKDRGSLLSGNQSAVVEKESLSSERCSKDEAISGSDVSNNQVLEDPRVMKNHGHPLSSNSIDEPQKSIIKATNMQATDDLQEKITCGKHATTEEPTVNLELAEGPLPCYWRDISSNLFPKHRCEWSEDLKSFLITATLSFDDDSRADLSPDYLLWTCRESSEVYLKYYHRLRGVRPMDGEYHRPYGTPRASCVRVQNEGWIDFDVDTLVAKNIERTCYTLAWLQSRVDLSGITNLAISENPLYETLDDLWWRNAVPFLVEEQFPGLKYLYLIANHVKEADEWEYSRGHFGPLAVVKTTDVRFMNELKRVIQIERLALPMFYIYMQKSLSTYSSKLWNIVERLSVRFVYAINDGCLQEAEGYSFSIGWSGGLISTIFQIPLS
ncbi:uncharacterized protein Bfra_004985 [Botrytis fragariae]|uniref:Uncharacterized protein n=1 Tax=Botrytis fragariae TaxID=1964551 RepID=A0A8H6ATX0_9HELO|nr:uncharacterized protein Bfra_004985 [Botrytis fragariae]KAF5873523.1 hypothetical protein Bfra_004985 [Botrytis fragariae]